MLHEVFNARVLVGTWPIFYGFHGTHEKIFRNLCSFVGFRVSLQTLCTCAGHMYVLTKDTPAHT